VEDDPKSGARQELLKEELTKAGADKDEQLLQAARALLEQVDPQGSRKGAYTVIQQQAGDYSVQIGQVRDVNLNRSA
jgi:ribosomal protein S6